MIMENCPISIPRYIFTSSGNYGVQIKETLPCYLFAPCFLQFTLYLAFCVTAGGVRDGTASGSSI